MDRRFVEKAWKWLLSNPEIFLADRAGHRFDALSLPEVEERNAPKRKPEKNDVSISRLMDDISILLPDGPNSKEPENPLSQEKGGLTNEVATTLASGDVETLDHQNKTASSKKNPDAISNIPTNDHTTQHDENNQPTGEHDEHRADGEAPASSSGLRLYAAEDLMWHAMTGHGPDLQKIKSLEFSCLSTIAAHGPKGIAQNYLIEITAQDKKSLPARTDRLYRAGYIIKKPVTIRVPTEKGRSKLLNTSQLVLKRFVDQSPSGPLELDAAAELSDDGPRNKKKAKGKMKIAVTDDEEPHTDAVPPMPRWVPDRCLSNQIFSMVAESGTEGMTSRVSSGLKSESGFIC